MGAVVRPCKIRTRYKEWKQYETLQHTVINSLTFYTNTNGSGGKEERKTIAGLYKKNNAVSVQRREEQSRAMH